MMAHEADAASSIVAFRHLLRVMVNLVEVTAVVFGHVDLDDVAITLLLLLSVATCITTKTIVDFHGIAFVSFTAAA